jgi:hypothetical protein
MGIGDTSKSSPARKTATAFTGYIPALLTEPDRAISKGC